MKYNLNQLNRRLEVLETVLRRPCQTCNDHPIRQVFVDPETETVWRENIPETGCPECGAPVFREMRIVVAESEGSAMIT